MATDHVEKVLAQWRRERPDLDCTPMGLWGRLQRAHGLSRPMIEKVFKAFGLASNDFDVLATLRRSGAPYSLTPTELYRSAMLSSGAMTNRIDRLEQKGLVRRLPSQEDRRSLKVQLTEDGLALIDRAVAAHVANERTMMAPLDEAEQAQLKSLLGKWLAAHEDR
ncbi:MarR family transcriptional regulator [Gallaecimonas sp. GXIMD4217]|uniref:MarR family winged helix-turn-helix transcriptional regulator n=1 Tax=Gallaecimonas sp. GXIMD4217 TaxID=3131927 RepID=UPI00311B3846